jgi:hypothetical protein
MSVSFDRDYRPWTLSSVTPAAHLTVVPHADTYRDDSAASFVSALANGWTAAGTFGASGRYVVGGFADSVVVRACATRAERTASALAFVAGAPIGTDHGVGFWQEGQNGRVWLDRVRSFDDRDVAIAWARANGEIAIYDRFGGDDETIFVN